MFGKGTEGHGGSGGQSIIQDGVTIHGDLKAESDIRLDGALDGTVCGKGRITIGATGSLTANVEGAEVIVLGRVIGNVTGHERVELRKGAHVEGDLTTEALVIEEGVFFRGFSQMLGIAESAPAGTSAAPAGPAAARGIPGSASAGLARGNERVALTGPSSSTSPGTETPATPPAAGDADGRAEPGAERPRERRLFERFGTKSSN